MEKRKELEAEYTGKLSISDLKDMQWEFQIKKNKLEDLEFENENSLTNSTALASLRVTSIIETLSL